MTTRKGKEMSVYSGTIGEAEYADGRDEGRAAALALSEAGYDVLLGEREAEGREAVKTALSARSRAFYIGWLRGFREVTR